MIWQLLTLGVALLAIGIGILTLGRRESRNRQVIRTELALRRRREWRAKIHARNDDHSLGEP